MIVSSVLLYRQGLAASMSADGRLEVVSVTDPTRATAEATALAPDAVVFDASGEEALVMARRLKRLDDRIVLVGFGISNSAQHVVACAEAGLAGFIDENGSIDALVQTIVGALHGEFTCSPRVTAILCERLASLANHGDANDSRGLLTPREREIASLVSEGLSNKEIALGLRIGPATVKNHVHNILDKLGVRRRAGIAGKVPLGTLPPAMSELT
jgi:DNA-binding NarL/FixJ family response regulator